MAAYSPRRSSGPVLRSTSHTGRCNRHNNACTSLLHSTPSATSAAFTVTRSLRRSASPTRINLYKYTSPSLNISVDRPGSSNRSVSLSTTVDKPPSAMARRRTCMCSPTNHPGSFRCSLHKSGLTKSSVSSKSLTVSYGSSSRLNMMRSAMKNSLVRIGTVEGNLVKRALVSLIRPSSHHQRRRGEFRPRPSRFSTLSEC